MNLHNDLREEFQQLSRFYRDNRFLEIMNHPKGIYFLKLKSISRSEYLRRLAEMNSIRHSGMKSIELFEYLFLKNISFESIERVVKEVYNEKRLVRKQNEDFLISQLYKMQEFNWGGLYQNSLERAIVNNYVKKIKSFDELNVKIESELQDSMRGYVQCSWYNHWSSIIIQDIFGDHGKVFPAVGEVKKVDFFIYDIPFDLKVTYFPEEFLAKKRREKGLRTELSELKEFCQSNGIWFDKSQRDERELFRELLAKVTEHPTDEAKKYVAQFRLVRQMVVKEAMDNPKELEIWLYENQGTRRFDAANRFFLILVDEYNLEESWKLKRNIPLLKSKIDSYLDNLTQFTMENLKRDFYWEGDKYTAYAATLFVTHNFRRDI